MTYPDLTTTRHTSIIRSVSMDTASQDGGFGGQDLPLAGPDASSAVLAGLPAAGGAPGGFPTAREQFASLLGSLEGMSAVTAAALRVHIIDLLRQQGTRVEPVFLPGTESWLDAACSGQALPDASSTESLRLGALLCQLNGCPSWSALKRECLKQAMLSAFDTLGASAADASTGPGMAPAGLGAADSLHVATLLREMVGDLPSRRHKRTALINLLSRNGCQVGTVCDSSTWSLLPQWRPDTPERALGLPQLLDAIDSMPAHDRPLQQKLAEVLGSAIHAHVVNARAVEVVQATPVVHVAPAASVAHVTPVAPVVPVVHVVPIAHVASGAPVARCVLLDETQRGRLHAVWTYLGQHVQPGKCVPSTQIGRGIPHPLPAGLIVCYNGTSGSRITFQSLAQSCSGDMRERSMGLAFFRDADGLESVQLDLQPITDPALIDALLLAAEGFLGGAPPQAMLGTALALMDGASDADAAQKGHVARFLLCALLDIDSTPPAGQPSPPHASALPAQGAGHLLQALPLMLTRADMHGWCREFTAGHTSVADVLAQSQVDRAIELAATVMPDADAMRFYPRRSAGERDAVCDALLAFAEQQQLFALSTLFWRAKPREPSGIHQRSEGCEEYNRTDGRARLTDMLCALQEAFVQDPEFVAACNTFAGFHAMGCQDRATLGITGLGLLLNCWTARADPVRALQAMRALVDFHRMLDAGCKIAAMGHFSGESAQPALRLTVSARTRHLPLPDGGPRAMHYSEAICTLTATAARIDDAMAVILRSAREPVLSTPAIQTTFCGPDFLQRHLPGAAGPQQDAHCDAFEAVMAPYVHLSLLPTLLNTPLTVPVLKRMLKEVVSPTIGAGTALQRLLGRLFESLRPVDGLPVAVQKDQITRATIGELLHAICRQDGGFADAVAGRISINASLAQQCEVLSQHL